MHLTLRLFTLCAILSSVGTFAKTNDYPTLPALEPDPMALTFISGNSNSHNWHGDWTNKDNKKFIGCFYLNELKVIGIIKEQRGFFERELWRKDRIEFYLKEDNKLLEKRIKSMRFEIIAVKLLGGAIVISVVVGGVYALLKK